MTSTRQKNMKEALRRAAILRETGVQVRTVKRQTPLESALGNALRTATMALDMAGVPEHLQGAGEDDWDTDGARDYDVLFGPGSE